MRIMYFFKESNERILKILLAQHFLMPFLSVVNGRLRIENVIFQMKFHFMLQKMPTTKSSLLENMKQVIDNSLTTFCNALVISRSEKKPGLNKKQGHNVYRTVMLLLLHSSCFFRIFPCRVVLPRKFFM